MTRLKLKYVHRFRDRHGILRHYFRRPGHKQLALPGLPGSAEFMVAYQAALAGETAPKLAIGIDRVRPGSIAALKVAWYQSAEFLQLAKTTQTVYRRLVEGFAAKHGDKPAAALQAPHIRRIIAERFETPEAANKLLGMIRQLMRFAVENNWRPDDPTIGIRKIRTKSEGFHTWTEEEIAQFEARWPLGSRPRLALALLLYTGQRRSDVVRMGRQHVRSGAIDVVQQKTGAYLSIPIHPRLREALDASPSDHLTFVTTAYGAPFTSAGFGNWFRDCCEAAKLPKACRSHGLRKAASRRLAEAGCTTHEIMAITSHTTLSEVERYTKAADQRRLAESAMRAMSRQKQPE